MDYNAVGIPVAFLLLAAMGLWLIIFAKGYWWLKCIFIAFVLYFSLAMWASLSQLSGWPTDVGMPDNFLVHAILVEEPSKSNLKEKGAIYMWASEIDENHNIKKKEIDSWLLPFVSRKNASEPRVYRLPYSEELHEQARQISKMLKAGKSVVGKGKKIGDGEEGEEGDGDGKGKGKGKGKGRQYGGKLGKGNGNSFSQRQEFMFYELPPFMMPDKGPEGQ
jgi:hypothetical protein